MATGSKYCHCVFSHKNSLQIDEQHPSGSHQNHGQKHVSATFVCLPLSFHSTEVNLIAVQMQDHIFAFNHFIHGKELFP